MLKLMIQSLQKPRRKKGVHRRSIVPKLKKGNLGRKRRPTGIVNLIQTVDPNENEEYANQENKEQEPVIQSQDLWTSDGICTNRNLEIPSNASTSESRDGSLKDRQSWMEELQKAVRGKRQDNQKLTTQLNDKEGSLLLLQKEIKTLTQSIFDLTALLCLQVSWWCEHVPTDLFNVQVAHVFLVL
ncbi:unnamed protein product [Ranitomeya imitator]|uniref:Uncharacterized protein n=1 Tax=Ranitomeya imitator TaxID=111125 RepID=A0ABN9KW10_9NEOB|nr:unnamed protein product [Ranitomeya imitator]